MTRESDCPNVNDVCKCYSDGHLRTQRETRVQKQLSVI
jgi:hypothetical protein